MTTHELAAMLDHLRTAFAFGLSKAAAGDIEVVAASFREGPDQKTTEFLKAIRAARAPATATAHKGGTPDTAALIDRFRAFRAGSVEDESLAGEVGELTADALKTILRAFGGKVSGSKNDLQLRARQLLTATAEPPPAPKPLIDPLKVTESVETLTRLRDSKDATVAELRSVFEPIRDLPKPAVEEIAKQMGYTLSGTKEEVLRRLLSNLEGIKASQYRAEEILNAV